MYNEGGMRRIYTKIVQQCTLYKIMYKNGYSKHAKYDIVYNWCNNTIDVIILYDTILLQRYGRVVWGG